MTTITIPELRIDLGELSAVDFGSRDFARVPLEDFSDLGGITYVGYRFEPEYPKLSGPIFRFEVREGDYADQPRKLHIQPDYDGITLRWLDDEEARVEVSMDVRGVCHAIYGALLHAWNAQIMPAMLGAALTAMTKADGYLR